MGLNKEQAEILVAKFMAMKLSNTLTRRTPPISYLGKTYEFNRSLLIREFNGKLLLRLKVISTLEDESWLKIYDKGNICTSDKEFSYKLCRVLNYSLPKNHKISYKNR